MTRKDFLRLVALLFVSAWSLLRVSFTDATTDEKRNSDIGLIFGETSAFDGGWCFSSHNQAHVINSQRKHNFFIPFLVLED